MPKHRSNMVRRYQPWEGSYGKTRTCSTWQNQYLFCKVFCFPVVGCNFSLILQKIQLQHLWRRECIIVSKAMNEGNKILETGWSLCQAVQNTNAMADLWGVSCCFTEVCGGKITGSGCKLKWEIWTVYKKNLFFDQEDSKAFENFDQRGCTISILRGFKDC